MYERGESSSSSNQVPAVAFHQKVTEEMGSAPPVLLFEKVLEGGDVELSAYWLFVRSSNSRRLMEALTPEERGKVYNEVRIGRSVLPIVATDLSGRQYLFELEKWPIGETLLLAHDWMVFVRANGLQQADTVQFWGYRLGGAVAGEFRLALNFFRQLR